MSDLRKIEDAIAMLRVDMLTGFQKLNTTINGDELGTIGLRGELRTHARQDEAQFNRLEVQQKEANEKREEMTKDMNKYAGGLAVLVFLVGTAATLAAVFH